MGIFRRLWIGGLAALALAAPVWADAVIQSTIGFSPMSSGVVISPSSGTLQILSPASLSLFAQALDSTGGFDQASSTGAHIAALTTVANADAAAGLVDANVLLPNPFDGFASSTGQAGLTETFQITGATGPVSTTFSAMLAIDQFLQTTGAGVSASSETIFTFTIPALQTAPILPFDNPLTLGPGQMMAFSSAPTLTNTVLLQPNTPYQFFASLDAESTGVSMVPEPPTFALLLTGIGILAFFARRIRRHS